MIEIARMSEASTKNLPPNRLVGCDPAAETDSGISYLGKPFESFHRERRVCNKPGKGFPRMGWKITRLRVRQAFPEPTAVQYVEEQRQPRMLFNDSMSNVLSSVRQYSISLATSMMQVAFIYPWPLVDFGLLRTNRIPRHEHRQGEINTTYICRIINQNHN